MDLFRQLGQWQKVGGGTAIFSVCSGDQPVRPGIESKADNFVDGVFSWLF